MNTNERTLGTSLRHLTELFDSAVEQAYGIAKLDYRPRYTPMMRALIDLDSASIRRLARHAGLTHSAASQTLAQMAKDGLLEIRQGLDAREHIVSLTAKARDMIPVLREIWRTTNAAASELDAELPFPLSSLVEKAIEALVRRPFADRRAAHPLSEKDQ